MALHIHGFGSCGYRERLYVYIHICIHTHTARTHTHVHLICQWTLENTGLLTDSIFHSCPLDLLGLHTASVAKIMMAFTSPFPIKMIHRLCCCFSARWDVILFFPDLYNVYCSVFTLPRFPYVSLAFFLRAQPYPKCGNTGSRHGFQEAGAWHAASSSLHVFQTLIFTSTPTSAGGKTPNRWIVNTSTSISFLDLPSVPPGSSISKICWSVGYLFQRWYFRNSIERKLLIYSYYKSSW